MSEFEDRQRLIEMLKRDEGVSSTPYDDATGNPVLAPTGNVTIGIGRHIFANPLTEDEMLYLLKNDIKAARKVCAEYVGQQKFSSLTSHRRLALTCLAFNLGNRLKTFKKMLAAIESDDWQTAAKELRDSLWAKQVDPKGRVNEGRDDRLALMLEKDVYPY